MTVMLDAVLGRRGAGLFVGVALAAALSACGSAPTGAPAASAHVTLAQTAPVAQPVEAEEDQLAPAAMAQPARSDLPIFLRPPFERIPTEGKAILVNIPSYELVALEDGREVLRSRVVVGRPADPTPIMIARTSVVRFRPTWTPTETMVEEEGLEPHTREPGKYNPLGLLAIRLEPDLLIYLHDTNNPQHFKRKHRAISHGCIRVEKWDELAAFVLGTSVEQVRAHANGDRTFDMRTEGVPVIIRYHTEFPDDKGVMREYADVYGRSAYAAARTDWNAVPAGWTTN